MRWVDLVIEALLRAPTLALLALAFGVGQRFGARCELWGGAAAAVAAVGAGWLSSATGLGPVANAAAVVPLVFGAAYLLGVFVTTRPEIAGDPTRMFTASSLLAVAAVAVTVLWRGDDPVAATGGGNLRELFGGPSVSVDSAVDAAVASAAILALGALVTLSRFRVRLVVMDRAPELLVRAGHDARQVSALFGAVTASAAGLAGVLAARHGALTPTAAVALTVAGAETALLGGLGSIPGAIGAAAVLSLLGTLGDEVRQGWGGLAVHAVVLVVLFARQGHVGRWSTPRWEAAR